MQREDTEGNKSVLEKSAIRGNGHSGNGHGDRGKKILPVKLSDDDIHSAMEEISGFLDITPEDFREIYIHAFEHATHKVLAPARKKAAAPRGLMAVLKGYFSKMRGGAMAPARVTWSEILWSWMGAFLGISAVGLINVYMLSGTDLVMIIGSFGASAVLIYGAIKSPLAQPRNLLGGHILSGVIGVFFAGILPGHVWLASSLAVATAIGVMHYTRTLHPPGGATALIAVIGSAKIHNLGYLYAFIPAGLGALVMLVVAVLINNLSKARRYPEFWI